MNFHNMYIEDKGRGGGMVKITDNRQDLFLEMENGIQKLQGQIYIHNFLKKIQISSSYPALQNLRDEK